MSSNRPAPAEIGVIGLGEMGAAMSKRLIEKGFLVYGHDIDPDSYPRAKGIRIAADIAAIAAQARPLLVMVDSSDQVVEVAQALAPNLSAQQLVMVSSTIDHWAVTAAASRIGACGAEYIDAPVSGSAASAAQGKLAIAAGCDSTAYAQAKPILDALCRFHCHVGPVGAGFAAKMINNLIFHITSVGLAEVMSLARHQGCDPEALLAALQAGPSNSAALRARAPRYLSRDFTGVPMRIAYREILMELELAHRMGQPAPLGEITKLVHDRAMAAGLGAQEGAALIQIYEHQGGLSLSRSKATAAEERI